MLQKIKKKLIFLKMFNKYLAVLKAHLKYIHAKEFSNIFAYDKMYNQNKYFQFKTKKIE